MPAVMITSRTLWEEKSALSTNPKKGLTVNRRTNNVGHRSDEPTSEHKCIVSWPRMNLE